MGGGPRSIFSCVLSGIDSAAFTFCEITSVDKYVANGKATVFKRVDLAMAFDSIVDEGNELEFADPDNFISKLFARLN